MMHDKDKQFADVGDVRVLKYIFVDALDADPTFDSYQEDYEYCRSKGLFEPVPGAYHTDSGSETVDIGLLGAAQNRPAPKFFGETADAHEESRTGTESG